MSEKATLARDALAAALPERVTLVATDLDGTLLNGEGRISARALAAGRSLRHHGVEVVMATGRSPQDVRKLARILGGRYAVCLNGAVILDLAREAQPAKGISSPDVISAAVLHSAHVSELAQRTRAAYPDVELGIESTDLLVVREEGRELLGPRWDPGFREVPYAELTTQPAMKLFVSSLSRSGVELQGMIEKLSLPEVSITRSTEVGFVEIAAAGVSKGAGLQEVCALLGADLGGMVAMGDMPNDLEMLSLAACGVAMGNADELVFEVAHVQTLAHTEEGAALVLEAALAAALARSLT